jgi:glucokinase-like ROK family protein
MRSRNPADQGFLRELNLSAVLRLIYTQAPLARAQLAKKTGLNKSTVSSLVEDLMLRKLVYETGTNSNTAGRPSTLLEINPKVGAVIAVELGVDFVAAALIDFAGKIHWRKQISADPAESQAETIGQTRALVAETLAISRERDLPVLALSFAIPGTVDLDAGVLIFAPNLNWRNVSFRTIFADSQLKIYVENDANAAAVGEHLFGAAQDAQDFVFVFAGVGLGGGLFLNDRLYRGKSGAAGEIGHTPIRQQPVQPECHCGNRGCWETYANQASIVSRIQTRLDGPGREGSLIASLMEEQRAPLSISLIKQAADAGDHAALAALADAGAAMGNGMAGLINVLNPEKIILGGPVSIAGDHLLPSILETVQAQSMHGTEVQTEIKVSAFGPDASLIGAAAVVVDDILTYPTQVAKEVMAGTESVSVEAGI